MKVLAPAKLNLFLKVINKKNDGYHNICTGVTFLNLYDEIDIFLSKKNSIVYSGPFAPRKGYFTNDILKKLLKFLYIKKKDRFFVTIKVKKNIPTGSGLGSASACVAAVIRGLRELKLFTQLINKKNLAQIGADIPMCLKSQDCIAKGIGEKISFTKMFPKYCFVLIKPNLSFSTKKIYAKIKKTQKKSKFILPKYFNHMNLENDFKDILFDNSLVIRSLIKDLSILKNVEFVQMTGTGSCCYAAFKNIYDAKNGLKKIKSKYGNYWSLVAENKFSF